MKRMSIQSAIAILALAAGNAAMASEREEPVPVNVRGLQAHVAEQVQQHAAEGQTRLMQYMWFTRKLHHLWFDDLMKPEPDAIAKNEKREKRQEIVIRTTGVR